MIRATARSYVHAADYERVGRFLVRTYGASAGGHVNWLQPRWEYVHYHGLIAGVGLGAIGLWEAGGEIVGVVHAEHSMGTAYFEIDPVFGRLKGEMLAHAQQHLCSAKDGRKTLGIYINDRDDAFQHVAAEIGYEKQSRFEAMSHFIIPDPFPAISLPNGFRLKSLAEDNDMGKIQRLLWCHGAGQSGPLGGGLDCATL